MSGFQPPVSQVITPVQSFVRTRNSGWEHALRGSVRCPFLALAQRSSSSNGRRRIRHGPDAQIAGPAAVSH